MGATLLEEPYFVRFKVISCKLAVGILLMLQSIG